MKTIRQLPHRSLSRLSNLAILCFCASVFCPYAFSQDGFYLENIEHFGIEEDDFDRMQIIPTSMMENHTLFLTAKFERDASMSMTQRLMNNRWLLDDPSSSYSGTEALRRYIRLYFIQHWKTKFHPPQHKRGIYLPVAKPNTISPFARLSNYQLRLSDDKVHLRFRYKFK